MNYSPSQNEDIVQILSSYFSQRGSFLSKVILADLKSNQGKFSQITQKKQLQPQKLTVYTQNSLVSERDAVVKNTNSPTPPQNKPSIFVDPTLPSLEKELIKLVAQQTGFPESSLDLEARLLDDLNLDSIKGGELIAEFAKKFDLAGVIDPTTLGNASLREIVAVVQQHQQVLLPPIEPLKPENPQQSKEVDISQLLWQLIEEQTGFPQATLKPELRLLDDLNLDSIKAAELIAMAAQKLGIAGKLDPSSLANATLADVVIALQQAAPTNVSTEKLKVIPEKPSQPLGKNWVRNFALEYIPQAEIPVACLKWSTSEVVILADNPTLPLPQALAQQLLDLGASARILTYEDLAEIPQGCSHYIGILPAINGEKSDFPLESMVSRLQVIATLGWENPSACIAYVQFGGGRFGLDQGQIHPEMVGASAFARSVHLERPHSPMRVIDLDSRLLPSEGVALIVQELADGELFRTVGYDLEKTRLLPQSSLQQPINYQNRHLSWSEEDVILVTGGAKGITAECAWALAQKNRVKMALVGRSTQPETFARFTDAGLDCRYYSCDLADQKAVTELVERINHELGAITGVVHGAGLNQPRRCEQVSVDEAIAEVSPKLLGAYHLLQALAANPPKLILGFSSIIGVTGMAGNAWYGFANESLAQLLRHFHHNHPETQTQALAYSVWDEVGMGARLGSVKHLERMGIGAIEPQEGVRRFLELFACNPGVSEVIVSARLGGLDTWHPQVLPETTDLRFIEDILYVEPNVSLIVRTHLNLERDLYVKDHIWRGSYLFPTVFGLEAMAQAAAYVTGEISSEIVRIENISLRRPVVVNPISGVTIQIQAEVLETNAQGQRQVKIVLGSETTGFETEHFAATFVLGKRPPGETIAVEGKKLLAIMPKVDLYGGLLFQGELFQRLEGVYSLSREKSLLQSHVLRSEEVQSLGFPPNQGTQMLLGDPYYRDVLLQSMQLNIPQDICLPVQIERIEFFENPALAVGERLITAILHEKQEREYICEVISTNVQGQILEKLQGYRLKILEEHPENPTALELANPAQRDENKLRQLLEEASQNLNLVLPTIALDYLPALGRKNKKQRLSLECPVVERALKSNLAQAQVDFKLQSLPSGKPQVIGTEVMGLELSLSHDDHYCLCVVGKTAQGCDIEAIAPRSSEDWLALLGETRQSLLETLVKKGDSLDRAGTRIWSAIEAVQKAENGSRPQIEVIKRQDQFVLLCAQTATQTFLLLTLPVQLTRRTERIVTLIVQPTVATTLPTEEDTHNIILPHSHRVQITEDGPQGQPVYEHRFQVSFKQSSSISRKVSASQFIGWVGKIRELPMRSMAKQMVSDFVSGEWGMVTNGVSLKILGETTSYDTIQARCWLGNVINSSFDTYIEFCKVLPDQSLERVALAEVKATWVRLVSYGVPTPQPFPEYLQSYLDHFAAKEPARIDLYRAPTASLPSLPESLQSLDPGSVIYEVSPQVHHYGDLLKSETFQTTLEESNFVGNVYYGNYFTWQGRMLDLFLYSVAPEYLRVSTPKGEMIPVYAHMDYLREAMPFDKIRVYLYVQSVTECGASFTFEFYREFADGTQEKLQVGRQEVVWARRNPEGLAVAQAWPEAILAALVNKHNSAKAVSEYKLVS